MNLTALQAFVVFSESLNFTRAAERLHLSQPALHVKIRRLSEQLQVPLYRRVGRRIELTEPGRHTARFGREIDRQIDGFTQQLRTGTVVQGVVLAAGEGAYLYLLGNALREFKRRLRVPLELLTRDREGAIDAVRSGKAHLGIASLESAPSGLTCEPLGQFAQMLVMPRSHPLATKREIRLKDLSGVKLIVPPPDRPHRIMISRALQSANVDWEAVIEANGWELMLHFVRLNLGCAIVNGSCRIPSVLVARSLNELPRVQYHVFHVAGSVQAGPALELKKLLKSHITL